MGGSEGSTRKADLNPGGSARKPRSVLKKRNSTPRRKKRKKDAISHMARVSREGARAKGILALRRERVSTIQNRSHPKRGKKSLLLGDCEETRQHRLLQQTFEAHILRTTGGNQRAPFNDNG